jgi:ribulose-phosphate 3-epimerase
MSPTPTLRLAPSILSADFARLGEEVRAIEAAGCDLVHFDVMDNHYVPNLTIGPLVCEAIRPHVKIPIDVHLMVEPVDSIIPLFAKAGANIITFHPEASQACGPQPVDDSGAGLQGGPGAQPATRWSAGPRDGQARHVLLMSVNPGFGGQKFIPARWPSCAWCARRLTPMWPPVVSRSGWKWTAASRLTTLEKLWPLAPTPVWPAAPCLAPKTPMAATAL